MGAAAAAAASNVARPCARRRGAEVALRAAEVAAASSGGAPRMRRHRAVGRGGGCGAEAAGHGGCSSIERHGAKAAHRHHQAAGVQGLQRCMTHAVLAHTPPGAPLRCARELRALFPT